MNGITAPLVYAGVNQINFQVPYEVQPGESTARELPRAASIRTIQRSLSPSLEAELKNGIADSLARCLEKAVLLIQLRLCYMH